LGVWTGAIYALGDTVEGCDEWETSPCQLCGLVDTIHVSSGGECKNLRILIINIKKLIYYANYI
jgi:hypothetical protein